MDRCAFVQTGDAEKRLVDFDPNQRNLAACGQTDCAAPDIQDESRGVLQKGIDRQDPLQQGPQGWGVKQPEGEPTIVTRQV